MKATHPQGESEYKGAMPLVSGVSIKGFAKAADLVFLEGQVHINHGVSNMNRIVSLAG